MKISLSWLKEYLDTNATVSEISDTLTMIGLEVEEIIDSQTALKDFLIGEILEVKPHPNADKLHILSVDSGKEVLSIVCGAPNVRVGMKSVLALAGTLIPCYNEILKKSAIRGVESNGMLCSEKELGIGDDHTGIIDLKTDLPAGTKAIDYFKSDIIFDINVTPNRGDCFGVKGIARDLSATDIGRFKETSLPTLEESFDCPVQVKIETIDCPQYVLRKIQDVRSVLSPKWLQDRLKSVGLNPISALVDVTNYFSIGECRPLHVFDSDKVQGNLVVRSAKEGEKILALDDKEYTLSEGMIVISDDQGVQSIAGIMGGKNTACDEKTKNVLLESAYFNPISIARTARLLKIDSDAKIRFERGIDINSQISSSLMATDLIVRLCGGKSSKPVIAGVKDFSPQIIDFDFSLVSRLCGIDIPKAEGERILSDLGFKITGNKITVPSWRSEDVKCSADLVEEIIRIYGVDKIESKTLRCKELPIGILKPHQQKEVSLRRSLAGRGLNQCITYSFMDSKKAIDFSDKKVFIENPISSDLDQMRPNLIPNLLTVIKKNQDKGLSDIAVFEVGPVFKGNQAGQQENIACGLRAGHFNPISWQESNRTVDVFDVKADVLDGLSCLGAPENAQINPHLAPSYYHPAQSGAICLGKNILAYFGTLHPKILKKWGIKTPVVAFEILMDNLPETRTKSKKVKPLKISSLMTLTRDFAFVIDKEIPSEKIIQSIYNVDKSRIAQVRIFDVYTGDKLDPKQKSIAVKVWINQGDKTLNDSEIAVIQTQIINSVAKNTGASLRQ